MGYIRRSVLTFTKAQCSAWVASSVDFATTILLAQIVEIWYAYATLCGSVFGGITNCAINYKWVFHAFGLKKKYVAVRYILVWIGSIVLNTYGTYSMTEQTGLNFMFSKAIVAALVAIFWNYQMQRIFVFHHDRKNNINNKYEL